MSKIVDEKKYINRLIDNKITDYLDVFGALCIEGPKWSGKSWTSSYHAKSEFLVADPTNNFSNRTLAQTDPAVVLEGESPRLIDEWQEVPPLWDATRSFVDRNSKKGQIILTGSSTPKRKGILHSGTGRIESIRMSTMSLFETGDSTGQASLTDMIKGIFKPFVMEQVSIERIAYLISRGGWPGNIGVKNDSAHLLAGSYIKNTINEDVAKISENDGVDYKPSIVLKLLKALARNESTTASNNKIMGDVVEFDNETLSKITYNKYISVIDRMFLTDNTMPFSTNVRSSLRIKQQEKRHLSDPSLSAALLGLTPQKMLSDLNTMGFLFEALVEHDLEIYADAIGGKLYHYQDYDGGEIDAVIELDNGEWCAIEIKLGLAKAEEGADNLEKVCKSIEKKPVMKCVIYGVGNMAYQRQDGTYVIPVTSLRP